MKSRWLLMVVVCTLNGCMITPNNHSYISIICYRNDYWFGGHQTRQISLDCNKKRVIQYETKLFKPESVHTNENVFEEWKKKQD